MLKFTGDFEVGAEDIGCNGSIRAGSLMYEFQEIATSHAEALGIGFDELMADNRIWVMSKLRFRKYFELTEGQSYRIETYPRPKRGVTFYRDYYVYDKDDRLAAAGISHWCVINFRTRRIEKTDIDFDDEYIDKAAFDDGIGKIRADNPVYAGEHVVVQMISIKTVIQIIADMLIWLRISLQVRSTVTLQLISPRKHGWGM